eukprot:2733297-Amphidinium_carterae.1
MRVVAAARQGQTVCKMTRFTFQRFAYTIKCLGLGPSNAWALGNFRVCAMSGDCEVRHSAWLALDTGE